MIEFSAWVIRAILFVVYAAALLGVVWRWPWEPVKVEPGQFVQDENGEYWRV